MDIFAILGLILGFVAIITGYLMEGGTMTALLLLPPFIIVFGGTAGVTLFSYKMSDIAGGLAALMKTLTGKEDEMPSRVISRIVKLSEVCRLNGLMSMQDSLNDSEISSADFLTLKLGMVMALDAKTAEDIGEALEADIAAFTAKRRLQIQVFNAAGGFCPTFGIIGTVMGLVHVLGNMTDPESLVGAIAGAFIATLYGVGFANLVFIPMANRLQSLLKREELMRQMMADGLCMIVNGENTRLIENKLSAYYQAFPKGFTKYKDGISK